MYKQLLFIVFCSLALAGNAYAQTGSITGTITDQVTGEELPGATVFISEINRGTSSGIDGQFTLTNIPVGNYVLRVTYIGYETIRQDINISQGVNEIDFQLQRDFLGLDEIVVTGVGAETVTRQLGTNVVSISDRDLTLVPTYTFQSALTGKIAGATVTPSGQPGAPAAIILRGINTMGTSRPLIMVDGVEIDASNYAVGSDNDQLSMLSNIDFNDIERVEVVKGAAASTLYGAQGANGVIQIFTRSGQAGPTRVSFNTSWSFDHLNESRNIDLIKRHSYPVNDDGYIIGMNFNSETGIWSIPSPDPSPASGVNTLNNREFIGYIDPDGNQVPLSLYDNISPFYEGGATQNHNVSISGGTDRYNYLIGSSYMDQEGIEQGVGFERISFRLNSDTHISESLTLGLRSNYINSNKTGVTESGNNIQSGLGFLLTLPPFIDATWTNPEGYYPPIMEQGSVSTHALFFKQINDLDTETNRLIGNINANYTPLDFLEIDYKLGFDWYSMNFDRLQRNAQRFTNNALLRPAGYFERNAYINRNLNSILDVFLRRDIGNDFSIGIPIQSTTLFKFDWREQKYNRMTSRADEMPPGLGLETIRSGSIPEVDEYRETFVTYGFLVNQKFDIDEFGGFSLGFRADKSSAFGEGAEYSYFPRGDVYLRVSEFLPQFQDFLREFKLRAAYGEAGTQPGAYDRFVTLNQGNIGSIGYLSSPATASNPRLAVEESRELELGADVAFRFGDTWFNSIGFGVTYWDRENVGVIQSLEAPLSIGSNSLLNNAIDLSSDGLDITFDAMVFNSSRVNWFTRMNFGTSKTMVDWIANGEDLILDGPGGVPYIFREGEIYGAMFGRTPVSSLDQRDADGEFYIPEQVEVTINNETVLRPRDEIYTIIDGHAVNKYTKRIEWVNEQVLIGDPTPDFTLSMRNDISYGNFNVAFQLDWVQGQDIYNATRWWMYSSSVHGDFDKAVLIDGGERVGEPLPWNENIISDYNGNEPQPYRIYHGTKRNGDTSFFVEDGSYLKLREMTISYDFSEILGLRERNLARNLTLGLSGRNLFTLTNYTGFDPDVSHANQDSRYRGLDTFVYPNYRTITFNATINF
jgi:TonB-dependent starch-binding outer membrane protein SusC